MFAKLYHHFVEPHLTESREDWDNLSHGPTYTEKTAEEIDQKAMKEAVERRFKKVKAKQELAKAAESSANEESKEQKNSKDKKPDQEEKVEGNFNNGTSPTEKENQNQEDNSLEHSTPEIKSEKPLNENTRPKEKTLAKRYDEEKKEPKLEAAERVAWESFENCGKICQERKDCFQYVYYDNTCKLGLSFRLGKHLSPSDDGTIVYKSGWMVERIRDWTEDNACQGPEWPDIR